jgi:hypothetical protein
MRIIVQKGVTKADSVPYETLTKHWCNQGCPERMTIRDAKTSRTFYLIGGSRISKTLYEEANKINGLRGVQSGTGIQRYPSTQNGTAPPVSICDYCKKPFEGKRRFCKPSHKTRFYEKKKASFLNDALRRVAA